MKYHAPYGSSDPDAPYVDRNSSTSTSGSKIPADFPNWTQREIVDMIQKSGFTPDDVLQLAEAMRSQRMNYFVPGGTASAMTITPDPAFGALSELVGVPLRIRQSAAANAGAITINPNGLGNVPVYQADGSGLIAGTIPANAVFEVVYNGTAFLLVSGAGQQAAISKQLQNFIIIGDQKSAGTGGGTFSSGAWRTRDLNTIIADPQGFIGAGIVTLAANRVSLSAGSWLVEASAPALGVDGHKLRLYNVTAAAAVAYGSTENTTASGTGDQVQTRSALSTVLTLAAAAQFEVQHVCIGTMASIGFGIASDYGLGANNGLETYALFRAQKLD